MPADNRFTRRQFAIGASLVATSALWPRAAFAADPLEQLVAEQMRKASIPGVAVGITRDGHVTSTGVYGFADIVARARLTRDSMFHIASITKTVTALAIMRLVGRNRIRLDERIAPYLDFTIAGERADEITFRHLLMHTSGISDEVYYNVDFRERGRDAPLSIGEFLKAYLAKGGRYTGSGNLKARPGSRWDYCNVGYGLLGYLGGRVAGQDLRTSTRDGIFKPLGLRHVAWSIADTPPALRVTPYDVTDGRITPVEPVGFPDWSAGMMRASIGDLTRLVAIIANGGVVEGRRMLDAAGVAAMLDMQRPEGLPTWLSGQGLAWQQSPLAGIALANHWGGDPGVFTMAYVDPARRMGAVVLSNLSATAESRDAMRAIAAAALDLKA